MNGYIKNIVLICGAILIFTSCSQSGGATSDTGNNTAENPSTDSSTTGSSIAISTVASKGSGGRVYNQSIHSLVFSPSSMPGNKFFLLAPEVIGNDITDDYDFYADFITSWQTETGQIGKANLARSSEHYFYTYNLWGRGHRVDVWGNSGENAVDIYLTFQSNRTDGVDFPGTFVNMRFGTNNFFDSHEAPAFADSSDFDENYSGSRDNALLYRAFMGAGGAELYTRDFNFPSLADLDAVSDYPEGVYVRGTVRNLAHSGKNFPFQTLLDNFVTQYWFQSSGYADEFYTAFVSKDGTQVVAIAWENTYDHYFQSSDFAGCLHVGGYFGSLPYGEVKTQRGRIFFVESGGVDEFLTRYAQWKAGLSNPILAGAVGTVSRNIVIPDQKRSFKANSNRMVCGQ